MSKITTFIKLWKSNRSAILGAVFNNTVRMGLLNFLPDEYFIRVAYRVHIGKKLSFQQPKTFNEKLQWLKLNDRNPDYSRMVDKYLVKEYVAKVLGEDVIIPTLAAWDNVEEIDLDSLPEKFVLKCNHDSGGIVICKEKELLDKEYAIKKLKKCLKHNGYWYGREWPYKNVKPYIIAEQFIEDDSSDLKDYKFFCFDGKVKCFKVDFNRFVNHRANYFDREKKLLPFGEVVCPPDFDEVIELPENIEIMVEYAEKLAKGIPFVRVDFYNVNGKVYFGEITFYPASGFGRFVPEEWDEKLGEWLHIK